jgi:hypothetical protein
MRKLDFTFVANVRACLRFSKAGSIPGSFLVGGTQVEQYPSPLELPASVISPIHLIFALRYRYRSITPIKNVYQRSVDGSCRMADRSQVQCC